MTTFSIVEGYEPEVDYEEFKKDWLDPSTRSPDLKKKYGLSKARWTELRRKVMDETGIRRKPTSNYHYDSILRKYPDKYKDRRLKDTEFIQRTKYGWIVVKTIDYDVKYYGRFESLECAIKIRDKLVQSGWDEELGIRLKNKYGMDRFRPAEHKAMKLYNKFEWMYIYSDKLMVDIQKELELTSRMYAYLIKELHRIHGDYSRRDLRKLHGVTSKPMRRNYG